MAVAEALVGMWRRKFGDELLGVAVAASVARGDDRAYSDLELVVFLRAAPPAGEDQDLQRVHDGMLVEAEYTTEEEYVAQYRELGRDWFLAGSEVLRPLMNPELVERVAARIRAVRHPRGAFLAQAARRLVEVQEAFAKTLGAIAAGDREAVGLLLFDAALQSMATLALLNERPYTTFARLIPEARALPRTPPRHDELLDIVARGEYGDGPRVRAVLLAVLAGLEALLAAEGVEPYDTTLDPGVPNRRYEAPVRDGERDT